MCFRKKEKNIIRPKPVRSDNFLKIKVVIDKHDPMGLLAFEAPPDEYDIETAMIEVELNKISDLTKDAVHDIVYNVFKRQFNEVPNNVNINDIANDIINALM